ncbi:membrane protease subunit HflC [Legionella sainthelensi]|uniref:Protein HflC n=1 Tax=Legionella sainthelensi TaxID=28087 RepID=A0A0W0YEA9_9GAMM|nr:protease modulator HflC [Legionella sainthelensi]KTD54964.1 membrane protease subunit HflC [Legionella sainthelensi]VEH36366.1 membrane protease subunit HflC [Legionella sainthelensi]
MKNTGRALGILIFLIFLVLLTTVFTITQGQHGILLRLGRLVNDGATNKVKVLNPGLHFKVPFIENVRIFDTRIQTKDIKSTRIVTREKKDVMVDYYVKWQIVDLAQYFKSTGGSEFKAETLLEQQLNTLLRAQFGKRTIPEVVSGGRDDVMQLLRKAAQKQAGELGINVVDVRIKGIELPASTSNEIYQRMRADMQEIANRHRADGQAAAEQIQAKADADVMVLLAKTRSAAQKVRAIGQAKAASIYAEAYSQNKEFFVLYRSLLAYEGSFKSKKDILVLDQSSSFFDYFKQATPKNDGVPVKK